MEDQKPALMPVMTAEDQDLEIDLGNMIAEVLRRWKSILAAGLICAVAVAGIAYAMDAAGVRVDYSDETYEELTGDLTDSEVETIERLYSQYQTYRQQLEYYETTYETSYAMQYAMSMVQICQVEYVYTSNYAGTTDSFVNQTLGSEEYQAIAEALELDTENPELAVASVVTISGTDTDETNSSESESSRNIVLTSDYTGRLYVRVISAEREQCERIMEIAKAAVAEHLEELTASGMEIDLTEVGTNYTEGYDEGLIGEYQTLRTQIEKFTSELEDLEEDYIDELDDEQAEVFAFLTAKDQEARETTVYISKKMAAIGLLLGAGGLMLLYMVVYVFSGSIKSPDEARRMTGRPVLGIIRKDVRRRGPDKLLCGWADRLSYGSQPLYREEQKQVAMKQIREYAERCGTKKVFIAAQTQNPETLSLLEEMKSSAALDGLQIAQGDPGADGEAFTAFCGSDLAVIVTELKKTDRSSVESFAVLCREMKVGIIGNLVVEK